MIAVAATTIISDLLQAAKVNVDSLRVKGVVNALPVGIKISTFAAT